MNRTILVALIGLTSVFFNSCEEPIEYVHQDKPQLIVCEGMDKTLVHEALYSFQEDISAYYSSVEIDKNSNQYYIHGYSNFVQPGLSGIAPYQAMASPHTVKLMEELRKEKSLWIPNGEDSHLNYEHPFVRCLLGAIQKEDLRLKFESLSKVNYIKPKVLAVPLRAEVNAIVADPNLAMYVALDGFYQNLYDLELSETLKNE